MQDTKTVEAGERTQVQFLFNEIQNPMPGQPRFEARFSQPENFPQYPGLEHLCGTSNLSQRRAVEKLLNNAEQIHGDFSWPELAQELRERFAAEGRAN